MSFTLIVANGLVENNLFNKQLCKDANYIIAADGGADNCLKLKVNPHIVIGDFDSISLNAKIKLSDILHRIKDQNSTDLMKAIRYAIKVKSVSIKIIGAIGNRIDHLLANILCISDVNIPIQILDKNNIVQVVGPKLKLALYGKKKDIVSIFAISDVKGLTYTGLKWKLSGANVKAGWIGSSNEHSNPKATISLQKGKIMVIQSKEGQ